MSEVKFALNPFKGLFANPILYTIEDKVSKKIIEKAFCPEKRDKELFEKLLEHYREKGTIEKKKYNSWWHNFKGYDKYTRLNGVNIPIKEYEFVSKKDQDKIKKDIHENFIKAKRHAQKNRITLEEAYKDLKLT